MEQLAEAGAGFRSLTEAIDTTTPAGRMMMQMVGAFAEFERRHLSRSVLIVRGNAGVTDQHCIMVLQNQCVLQYRFATPKPLKTRPAPDRCVTVPLCTPGR